MSVRYYVVERDALSCYGYSHGDVKPEEAAAMVAEHVGDEEMVLLRAVEVDKARFVKRWGRGK